jgi:hypothetical protein
VTKKNNSGYLAGSGVYVWGKREREREGGREGERERMHLGLF